MYSVGFQPVFVFFCNVIVFIIFSSRLVGLIFGVLKQLVRDTYQSEVVQTAKHAITACKAPEYTQFEIRVRIPASPFFSRLPNRDTTANVRKW